MHVDQNKILLITILSGNIKWMNRTMMTIFHNHKEVFFQLL